MQLVELHTFDVKYACIQLTVATPIKDESWGVMIIKQCIWQFFFFRTTSPDQKRCFVCQFHEQVWERDFPTDSCGAEKHLIGKTRSDVRHARPNPPFIICEKYLLWTLCSTARQSFSNWRRSLRLILLLMIEEIMFNYFFSFSRLCCVGWWIFASECDGNPDE